MLKQLKKIWIGCVYAMTALLLISCRSANKELSDAEAKKAAVSELIKILELGREPESVSTGHIGDATVLLRKEKIIRSGLMLLMERQQIFLSIPKAGLTIQDL